MILFSEISGVLEEEPEEWNDTEEPDVVCPKCGATDDDIVVQMEGAGDDTHELLACTECGYTW